jgi:hypothetical protein
MLHIMVYYIFYSTYLLDKCQMKSTARQYSIIRQQKWKLQESFLTFFASSSNISMIIYELSKYNCQMLYPKETMA